MVHFAELKPPGVRAAVDVRIASGVVEMEDVVGWRAISCCESYAASGRSRRSPALPGQPYRGLPERLSSTTGGSSTSVSAGR